MLVISDKSGFTRLVATGFQLSESLRTNVGEPGRDG